jgi:hypothetical protein
MIFKVEDALKLFSRTDPESKTIPVPQVVRLLGFWVLFPAACDEIQGNVFAAILVHLQRGSLF